MKLVMGEELQTPCTLKISFDPALTYLLIFELDFFSELKAFDLQTWNRPLRDDTNYSYLITSRTKFS